MKNISASGFQVLHRKKSVWLIKVSRMCLLRAAEELALSLGEALSGGDAQEALRLCQRLSQLSVPVTVSVNRQAYPQESIR